MRERNKERKGEREEQRDRDRKTETGRNRGETPHTKLCWGGNPEGNEHLKDR